MIETRIFHFIENLVTDLIIRSETKSSARKADDAAEEWRLIIAFLRDYVRILSENDEEFRKSALTRLVENARSEPVSGIRQRFAELHLDDLTETHIGNAELNTLRNKARRLQMSVARISSQESYFDDTKNYRSGSSPTSSGKPSETTRSATEDRNSGSSPTSSGTTRSVEEVDPADDEPAAGERQINVWISEREQARNLPLVKNKAYTINFNVDVPYSYGYTQGAEAAIDESGIPEEGLLTNWSIISDTLEMTSTDSAIKITEPDQGHVYSADFELLIPKQKASATIQFQIKPTVDRKAGLEIRIFSGQQLYRKLKVGFVVRDSAQVVKLTGNREAVKIEADNPCVPAAHLNLLPPHEWTTPPGELMVEIIPSFQKALVKGRVLESSRTVTLINSIVDWRVEGAKVDAAIENVIAAAETFRARHEKYFDDIDETDFDQRIQTLVSDQNYARPYDWENLPYNFDPAHQQSWEAVSTSAELRELAIHSHFLYQLIFPRGSELRGYLESIIPGHRVNLSWTDSWGGWVPHIPWGLLYLGTPPKPGEAIDPMKFWGFKFRTQYQAYSSKSAPSDLGGLGQASQLYFLYWGEKAANKTTWNEAVWQKQRIQSMGTPNGRFVPSAGEGQAKVELLKSLESPNPPKTNVLYFYCQCSVGDNNNPILRFGDTNNPTEILNRTELISYTSTPFEDRPLVFLNACSTSSPDAYRANLLEQSFFERECRAYIGTECKVPIKLASRFATIFFKYLYRQVSPDPLAAGEAFTQAKLFLLTQYLNIGGLFYTYINLYDLYVADDEEVIKLRY